MSILNHLKETYIDAYLFENSERDGIFNEKKIRDHLWEWEKNRFNFFTPYKTGLDVGIALTLPIAAPIALVVATTVLAMVSALAAITSLACLLSAAACAIVRNSDYTRITLELAAFAAMVSAGTLVGTLATTLLALGSAPVVVTSLLTRTGATTYSACAKACSKTEDAGLELPAAGPALI